MATFGNLKSPARVVFALVLLSQSGLPWLADMFALVDGSNKILVFLDFS